MGKAFRKRNNQRTHKRPKNNPKQHSSHSSDGCTIFLKHRRVLEEPKENLKEEQVGITEFVTSGKGVTGVVKARFSDFHVNEIDQNGKVLQLDDLNIPQPKENGLDEEELAKAKCELNDVITSEVWDRIEALAQRKHQDAGAERSIELDVSTLDKEQRTKIHNIIKKLYERTLVSTTTNSVQEGEEEKKLVKIYPKKGKGDTRNRWGFPGEYVHFLVHKENMDTSEVASIMAGRLGLRPSQVNYCGTKDKRAKTTQKFCVKRRSPSAIVSSMKGSNGVHIGNFEFHAEVLKLGQLRGNRFRIALRLVGGENADIEAALQEIKERGFINYYGLQRFGNCASVPTYEIGIALLKCDYKLACELIMKPRENDAPFLREIRKEWWTNRNSTVAAAKFYSDKFIEKKLLSGLAQYGENDYASALRKIPRNMLLLYPHAFQSLLFNRIVSRRIKEFGLKLIPGDLVFRNKDEPDTEIITEIVSTEDDTESSEKIEPLGATLTDTNKTETESTQDDTESSEKIEPLDATLTDTNKTETVSTQDDTESSEIMEPLDANITDPNKAEIESKEEGKETITETELKEEGKETITETESKEEGKETITETEDKESVFKRKVKPLTAEDVASGEWTLFDVVLPLPGFDVTFPENEVAKWYEELLEEYGLSIAKLKHNVKTYSMPGAYRKIIIKPEEMKWEFKKYDKPESTLIASDWELLGRNKEQVLLNIKTVDGKFKAVLIDVKLPTAAYATMFLRELLKSDTSAASQSQLERAEMIKHNEKPPDEQFEDVKLKAEKREHKKDDSVGDKNGVEVEANDAKKMKPGEDSGE